MQRRTLCAALAALFVAGLASGSAEAKTGSVRIAIYKAGSSWRVGRKGLARVGREDLPPRDIGQLPASTG